MSRPFKTLGAVLCLVFALCLAAPNAVADSIIDGTLNFTVTSGSPSPTGSFVFDNTTNAFTSFTVDWDGVVYNYAAEGITLASLGLSGSWCAYAPLNFSGICAQESGFLAGFPSFFLAGGFPRIPELFTFSDARAGASGTYTVTETAVATPEPSSLALMLSGVGLLFAMRKRWALGLHLAS